MPPMLGALHLLLDGRIKVDDEPASREPVAAAGVEDGAASRCQDDTLSCRYFIDHNRFALAKARLALFFKDEGNIDACACFDLVVAVDELQVQLPRELPTDGRLAGAHRAVQ